MNCRSLLAAIGLLHAVAVFADQAPRINGPSVFGVRPGSALLYSIPVTGDRPLQFSAEGLPAGVTLDPTTGALSGSIAAEGAFAVTLHARNPAGEATRAFTIRCGETICLTPPMGWNSWNCWATSVDQAKVLDAAKAIVASGLKDHGWTYVNIDDTWQGARSGPDHSLQPNRKFPDMKALCDQIHAMGLKVGIYSTPWVTSYAGYPGGSADNPEGTWARDTKPHQGWRHGEHSFAEADARQWASWGVDYIKYDWKPIDVPHAGEMFRALRNSGRDIILSLSNAADPSQASDWAKNSNLWRTTGDIGDRWENRPTDHETWRFGVSEIAFSQDRWAAAAGPGHWNDPDMLVVGQVGWGPTLHPTSLRPDEQVSHITMWCMLNAPLILGCDLTHLDDFTRSLVTNDEVLALDQDSLGKQAVRLATVGSIDVFVKPLADGSTAVAFMNRSDAMTGFYFTKFEAIGLEGTLHVRDLWLRKDLPDCRHGEFWGQVPGHGALLLQFRPAR